MYGKRMKKVDHYAGKLRRATLLRLLTYCPAKYQSTQESANKPLHGLLRTKLDQRCPTEEFAFGSVQTTPYVLTTHISHRVVADDQRSRDEEPYKPLEDVVHDKVGRNDNEEQTDMNPTEEGKLAAEILPLQVGNEADKTCCISFALSHERIVAGSPTTYSMKLMKR